MFICQIGVDYFTYIESVVKEFGIETEKLKKQSHFKLEFNKILSARSCLWTILKNNTRYVFYTKNYQIKISWKRNSLRMKTKKKTCLIRMRNYLWLLWSIVASDGQHGAVEGIVLFVIWSTLCPHKDCYQSLLSP